MRVIFLVDGFNLYHSIEEANKDSGLSSKWLDLDSLLKSYLEHIDRSAKLEEILFFTALRTHVQKFNPDTVKRHLHYISILRSKGIKVILGKFKKGKSYCRSCKKDNTKYEEKETDVSIAVKLVELAFLDAADTFVIVSGDTDLMPGIDVVKRNFPQKNVFVIFPYKRYNTDVLSRVKGSFKIQKETYHKHQLPDPFELNGKKYSKPSHW